MCDVDAQWAQFLAKLPRPDNMRNGFQLWMVVWDGATACVELRALAGSTLWDYQAPRNVQLFGLHPDGSTVPVNKLPTTAIMRNTAPAESLSDVYMIGSAMASLPTQP